MQKLRPYPAREKSVPKRSESELPGDRKILKVLTADQNIPKDVLVPLMNRLEDYFAVNLCALYFANEHEERPTLPPE